MTQVLIVSDCLIKKAPIIGCLFFLLFFIHPSVHSQPLVEELVPLDFGTLAISSNQTVSTLELTRSGRSILSSGNIVVVESGVPGRYLLSSFPPNTSIEVNVLQAALTAGGTGIPEPLVVNQYDAGDVQTNPQGEAEMLLGASFSTTGNSGIYEDAPYSGGSQIRLTYWEPSVEEFVTVSQNVTFEGEVRTGLELTESKSLHFGMLFVRATPDDQATMRLFPDGRVEFNNPGNARIVSLSTATPGSILVSGAAPRQQLSIEVQETDVILRQVQNPSGPHFVLSDLQTLPSVSGLTDQDGLLQINVGGTLKTQLTVEKTTYPAGTYEGSYSITVSY